MTLRQVSNCKPVVLTTQLQPVVLQEGSLAPKTEPSVLPCAIPALGSAWEQPKLLAWTQTALLEAPVSEVPVRAPHPRLGPKMVCEHWREIRTQANPRAYIVMRHSFHSVTPSIKLALCHRACVFNYFSRLLPCSWCCWVVPSVSQPSSWKTLQPCVLSRTLGSRDEEKQSRGAQCNPSFPFSAAFFSSNNPACSLCCL